MSKLPGRFWLLFIPLFFSALSSFGQLNYDYTEGKYMIKGRVSDFKSEQGIANANIWIANQKRGVTAGSDGTFVMYVYPTDTLRFSSLGYISKTIPVSAIDEKDKYTIDMRLIPDIYQINTVVIYPFRNKQEFAEAFITGKGLGKSFVAYGMEAAKFKHTEKTKLYNPISTMYEIMKKKKQAADPQFKP
jgi:hypothetical protein